MKTTFLYALIDPRDGRIRYVGKSNNPLKRLENHLWDRESSYKNRWISELKRAGLTPSMELLDEVPDSPWQFWEPEYIRVFRAAGSPLTNTTAGGDGVMMVRTAEHNKKIGDAQRGRLCSEETRARLRALRLGSVSSEKQREAVSRANRHPKSDETRKRMSAAQKKRFADSNSNRFFGRNAAPVQKDENR